MTTRAFKSVSAQQLEEAIADAISAITGTDATVSVTDWRKAGIEPLASLGRDHYEIQFSLSVGKSYGESSMPPGVADKLGLGSEDGEF